MKARRSLPYKRRAAPTTWPAKPRSQASPCQEGNGYMSQPIKKAEPMKQAKAKRPKRTCSAGSSLIKRANATETNAANTVKTRKWLDTT